MITQAQKKLIKDSWRLVVPISETASDLFYGRLFELAPQYRSLFPDDMQRQKKKLMATLAFAVRSLDWTEEEWDEEVDPEEDLFLVVSALGRRHSELYHVPKASYQHVGEALIWTLDYGLGDAFTDEIKEAWAKVYRILSNIMIMTSESTHLAAQRGD